MRSELTAYLHRLGLSEPPPPTLAGLRAVHRAHVARIAYDNLSTMLGRPDPETAADCVRRVSSGGRLGYCFQQNAALQWLLETLGFSVSRRHGHVWSRPEGRLDPTLNHLVLVVSGLPSEENPGGHWWADAGLGEGFAEPLPLVRGEHDVDGWTFGIGAAYGAQAAGRPTGPAAWTYEHLAGGTFGGLVVTSRDHSSTAIAEAHRGLTRDEGSPFRRVLVVQRVDGARQLVLRGLVLGELTPTAGRRQRDLASYGEWRAAMTDELLLPLADVDDQELRSLWDRTLVGHRAWDAAGRP